MNISGNFFCPTKISVCLATYNGEKYLGEQIDSVLAQLNAEDELVVSDDGSTDETVRLLASYGDRLRIVGTSRAGGVVKNFERALSAARGDVVVLCDQDDIWLDGRVALIRERLTHVTLLMMNGVVVDSQLKPTGQDVYQLVNFRNGFLQTLVTTKYVGCCMAFRRELLDVTLPFPRNLQWHDWFIALVAELLFDVECAKQRTILFRRHAGNASTTGQPSTNSLMSKIKMRCWMILAVGIAISRYARLKWKGSR